MVDESNLLIGEPMKNALHLFLCLSMMLLLVAGCGEPEAETKVEPKPHAHEAGDELVWVKKNIEFEGHLVTLGHHGSHFHGGESIEPAIMLTKDGEDIDNAKTSCSLLDADGGSIVKADMIYEPKTEEEPAHYAQGELKFPSEERPYKIEFVVTVGDKEFKDSIEVKVGH